MKPFMDQDFLLNSKTAVHLYHDYAAPLPIIDYHCHLSPKEIAKDCHFDNIAQVWLGGDHYKWRQMRTNGVDESYITGNASDYDRFYQYACTLEKAIGNPLYHWSHLELQRYFGYKGVLTSETAPYVWDLCNEQLRSNDMSAQCLITKSNVDMLCTTDDPIDDLSFHKQILSEHRPDFTTTVLPAWRPDRAVSIEKADFKDYIEDLGRCAGITISTYDDLLTALHTRLDYFEAQGCLVSDHGMDFVFCQPAANDAAIRTIFKKVIDSQPLCQSEIYQYKTDLMLHLGREYCHRGFVMQLHFCVKRSNNTAMFKKTGPDTGFDCISNYGPADQLANFLDALAITDELPKTILYSLNPVDNAAIDSIIGCFQDSTCVGKIQHGAAWWFNDHKSGMEEQMTSLASMSLLGNFIGMLTDSRSFISYPRHEYFRRIVCNLVGNWVEQGEFPNDERMLKQIIEGISYRNAKNYFVK